MYCRDPGWLHRALLLLSIAFPSLLAGCYGPSRSLAEPVILASDEDEEPPPKAAPPGAAVKPIAAVPAAAAAPAAPTPKPPEPPKPLPTPQRPADFAHWTWDDLLSAREENDPALPQAAQHIVRTWAKDEDTVWLLARLLELIEPLPVAPPTAVSDDAPRPAAPPKPTLTVAGVLIPFFAALESSLAQETLVSLVKGDVFTDLEDAQALELIFRALAENPTANYEEMLGSILTEPSRWRPVDTDGITAERLHELCFKQVQATASPELRTRMAQYVVQSSTPPAHRERLGTWLAAPDPANLGAQVVLHNSDLLSPEGKARFREAFARLNSPALDQLLGVAGAISAPAPAPFQPFQFAPAKVEKPNNLFANPDQGALAGAKPASEDDRAIELMRHFWTEDFLASVARDVARMSDIGTQRELMLLASNLPHQTVRQEVRRALLRQWIEGPTPFETAKLAKDSFRDPGILVLVKSLPRQEPKPPPTGAAAAAQPKPTRDQQAKFAWMGAAESFLRSLNERFYTAARTNPRAAQPVGLSSAATGGGIPMKLQMGVPIVAEYHLHWPAQLPDGLKDRPIDPLELHYVRMEGEEPFQRVSNFYRGQLPSPASHNVARGQWLESQQPVAETGRIRSVDVLITREGPPPRSQTTAEDLVVEVLWMEIPDPTH
jgi:hypothetical protein